MQVSNLKKMRRARFQYSIVRTVAEAPEVERARECVLRYIIFLDHYTTVSCDVMGLLISCLVYSGI